MMVLMEEIILVKVFEDLFKDSVFQKFADCGICARQAGS